MKGRQREPEHGPVRPPAGGDGTPAAVVESAGADVPCLDQLGRRGRVHPPPRGSASARPSGEHCAVRRRMCCVFLPGIGEINRIAEELDVHRPFQRVAHQAPLGRTKGRLSPASPRTSSNRNSAKLGSRVWRPTRTTAISPQRAQL